MGWCHYQKIHLLAPGAASIEPLGTPRLRRGGSRALVDAPERHQRTTSALQRADRDQLGSMLAYTQANGAIAAVKAHPMVQE
jgi:hypothetical protein